MLKLDDKILEGIDQGKFSVEEGGYVIRLENKDLPAAVVEAIILSRRREKKENSCRGKGLSSLFKFTRNFEKKFDRVSKNVKEEEWEEVRGWTLEFIKVLDMKFKYNLTIPKEG